MSVDLDLLTLAAGIGIGASLNWTYQLGRVLLFALAESAYAKGERHWLKRAEAAKRAEDFYLEKIAELEREHTP